MELELEPGRPRERPAPPSVAAWTPMPAATANAPRPDHGMLRQLTPGRRQCRLPGLLPDETPTPHDRT